MKITIIGAAGFIGQHLRRNLEAKGYEVYCPEKNDPQVFAQNLGHVFYCAGLTADFRVRAFDTVQAHVSYISELLSKAQFDGLLYLSSTRVYGTSQTTHEQSALAVNPTHPSDLYNLSKLMGESICLQSKRDHVKVARLSNVVGMDFSAVNFLNDVIKQSLAGHIVLSESLESAKDYILIDDVVELLPQILFNGQDFIYNVASGSNLTHRSIVESLQTLTACSVSVVDASPTRVLTPIDINRIRLEFLYTPKEVLLAIPPLLSHYRKVI